MLLFSHSDLFDSLRPYELQETGIPCPSLSPRVCSNSRPLSSDTIQPLILCCSLLLMPSVFPRIKVISNESALCIRWPKYWSFSFSISPSSEHPGLISFRFDWFLSPCSPRDPQESSPASQFKSINSSGLSFLNGPTLTSIHDYWKYHSFDYLDLCRQSDVSAF